MSQNQEVEIHSDAGPVLRYGDQLIEDKEELREPLPTHTETTADFITSVRDRFSHDFLRHPKRDAIAAAVALGGLCFATGAVIASRHATANP